MSAVDHHQVVVTYSWSGGGARLRIRPVHGASTLVDAHRFSLHYRVPDPAVWHCPGHRPFRSASRDYEDCGNRPQPGDRRCVSCAVAEATLAGSLHHAHLRPPEEIDSSVDAHLRQPNILYLAAFGDGSLKIGTSTTNRVDQRLLEQGALIATVVAAAPDGIAVRHVEDLVTEKIGLPQSVGVARKLRGLVAPLPTVRLQQNLGEAAEAVGDLLTVENRDGLRLVGDSWLNPALTGLQAEKLFDYPADLRRDAHQLIVDYMIGRLAVVERTGGDRFVIDIGRIFGLELELGDFDPVEITIQDSLF